MNDELVFVKFMRAHKCYHVIPTSSKLIIMDLELNVSKKKNSNIINSKNSI